MFENIEFVTKVCSIFTWEYSCYLLGREKKECIKNIVEYLGGLNIFFIKIFQGLSTCSYFLNPDEVEFMNKYTDNVDYNEEDMDTSFMETLKDVEVDGQKVTLMSEKPIKSGLIALVYGGMLNGKPVVIKVIRNGINEKIKDAFDRIDYFFNSIADYDYIKELNLVDLVEENKESILSQTNFLQEVINAKQMYDLYKNVDYVEIPKVYERFTHENSKMIVMDYVDGMRLEEILDKDKDDYSVLLAKYGMKSLLFDGYYHGDLHPGNIIFMSEPKRIGLIDFGIMGMLTREEQNCFYEFFTAINNNEYEKATRHILDQFVDKNNVKIDETDLVNVVQKIIKTAFECKSSLGPDDIYEINKELQTYGMQLSKSFCRLELTLAISHSVSSKLCHERSYLDNIKMVVDDMFDFMK